MSNPQTVTRAFELPVQAVLGAGGDDGPENGWDVLRECWQHSTVLANWCVQQLVRHDVVRTPDMLSRKDFPKWRDPDLYARIFGRLCEKAGRNDKAKVLPIRGSEYPGADFFRGAAISAATIVNEVQAKWKEEREAVLWLRSRSPASFGYPHPWPVHAQQWKEAWIGHTGHLYVVLALPGGEVTLRLRGGPERRRQVVLFRQIVAGEMPRRQVVIYQQPASRGCHRPVMRDGGEYARVMCKMVADFPVREAPGQRTLTLITDPEAFWVAELDGRRAWVLNNDHFGRWLAQHRAHLASNERLRQDAKAERRLRNGKVPGLARRMRLLADDDNDRMASWTHEAAAHLVGFAVRQRVGEIFYLDRDKGFMPSFPWFVLHQKLADKCKLAGIAMYSESALKLSGAKPSEGYDSAEADIQPTQEDDKWTRIAGLREAATARLVAARKRQGSHRAVSTP